MYTKHNFKSFFIVPTNVSGPQANAIGGVSENLTKIVADSFDHTTPEYASLITQKAAELNALITTAYGSSWVTGKSY